MNTSRYMMILGLALLVFQARAVNITIRVTVPSDTTGTVYIAGDFQGWDPGNPAFALSETGPDSWEITLDLPVSTTIQYKFTRGSWASVEKGPSGEEISNRVASTSGPNPLLHVVASWADLRPSTITGDVTSTSFPSFLAGRRVWVYLPPGYHGSSRTYPVLYMHDGQNLFDDATSFAGEWRADEAAEQLIAGGQIEPLIIVGIENSPSRISEYTPWPDPRYGGGGADAYLAALRDQLIPLVNAGYRTRTGPGHTYTAGSSLGGLVSAYASFAYPDTFGRVAAVSPSYWWDSGAMISLASQTGRPPTLDRFYQDMGTAEGGIAELRSMRDVLLAQGFVPSTDLLSVEAAGHAHNEFYWSSRFPSILAFLIDPPCVPDLNGDGILDNGDIGSFVALFLAGNLEADLNGDGILDNGDIGTFVATFLAGC